jgi:hypothetical protein
MDVVPFYGFFYKGGFLNKKDDVVCKDFGGDCYKFAKNYMKFKWFSETIEAGYAAKPVVSVFEGHQCTEEEITKDIFKVGLLHICPPADKVRIYNNYN